MRGKPLHMSYKSLLYKDCLFNHMKTSKSSYYNLLFILLTTSLSSSPQSSSWTDLIYRTCKLTPFSDRWISTLLNDPQSPSADTQGLAAIVATDLLQNTNVTLTSIRDMISLSLPDLEYEQPLAYCAEVYIPIVKYILPQSIEALENGRYVLWCTGSRTRRRACEKRVKGIGNGEGLDAVKVWNESVRELADVALAIIKVLQRSTAGN